MIPLENQLTIVFWEVVILIIPLITTSIFLQFKAMLLRFGVSCQAILIERMIRLKELYFIFQNPIFHLTTTLVFVLEVQSILELVEGCLINGMTVLELPTKQLDQQILPPTPWWLPI